LTNENKIEGVMTTADVMARLRVSRKTLYVLVAKHLPNAARIGREYRFIEADIQTIWDGMRAGSGQYGDRAGLPTTSVRPNVVRADYAKLRQMLTKKRKTRP